MPRPETVRSRSCCLRSMAMLLGLASFQVTIGDMAAARSAQHEGADVYRTKHDALLAADAIAAANSDGIRGTAGAQLLAWGDAALPGRALLHRGCHRPRCIPRCSRCSRLRRHCRRGRRIFNCEPRGYDSAYLPFYFDYYTYDYVDDPDSGDPPEAEAGSDGVRTLPQIFDHLDARPPSLGQRSYSYQNPFGYVYEEEVVDYIDYDYDAFIYIDTAYSAEDADGAAGPAADISSDLPAAGPGTATDEYPSQDELVSMPVRGPAEADLLIAIGMDAPADAPASTSVDGTYA
eukprot:jgi/Ulvmu1/11660/UM008_0065.1